MFIYLFSYFFVVPHIERHFSYERVLNNVHHIQCERGIPSGKGNIGDARMFSIADAFHSFYV